MLSGQGYKFHITFRMDVFNGGKYLDVFPGPTECTHYFVSPESSIFDEKVFSVTLWSCTEVCGPLIIISLLIRCNGYNNNNNIFHYSVTHQIYIRQYIYSYKRI